MRQQARTRGRRGALEIASKGAAGRQGQRLYGAACTVGSGAGTRGAVGMALGAAQPLPRCPSPASYPPFPPPAGARARFLIPSLTRAKAAPAAQTQAARAGAPKAAFKSATRFGVGGGWGRRSGSRAAQGALRSVVHGREGNGWEAGHAHTDKRDSDRWCMYQAHTRGHSGCCEGSLKSTGLGGTHTHDWQHCDK